MLNNTTLQRWHRSTARQLDAQFTNAIIEGMNCSPFEAKMICATVHEVYAPLMETTDALKPGQIRVSVIAASVAANTPLAQAQQCLVTLTLDAGEDDLAVRKQGGVVALRRHRFMRICEEAFQQGGLLTLEGIADLFNCAVRTLVTDFAEVRKHGYQPPLRSTVKDMGRALSHRTLIVTRWLAGLEYSDIARQTHHSVEAVGNYVDKYKRCVTLLQQDFDRDTVALIARLSPGLVFAFQQILEQSHPVPHRQEELASLGREKNPRPTETEREGRA